MPLRPSYFTVKALLDVFPRDRVWLHSALLAGCFCGVLLLSSQSAASLATYALALSMVASVAAWKDVFRCPMIWPVAAVLIYYTLTAFWSADFSFRDLLSIVTRAVLTFCFVVAVAECQVRGLLHTWLTHLLGCIGAGVALFCIALFYAEPPLDGRLNGLGQLDTQVVAALVFGFTLILLLHSALQRDVRFVGLLWAAIAVLSVAIFLTGSRNALLSVVYGALVLFLVHRFRTPGPALCIGFLVAVLALVAIALAWFDPATRDLLFPRGDSFRMVIWQGTLDRLQSSPWFGIGILSSDDIASQGLVFHHPHNLYLSAASQGGVLGLLLFLWLLARVLRELIRFYGQMDAKLALGILGLALPAYLLDGHELLDKISDTWFLVWLPVAIALGLRWHATYK